MDNATRGADVEPCTSTLGRCYSDHHLNRRHRSSAASSLHGRRRPATSLISWSCPTSRLGQHPAPSWRISVVDGLLGVGAGGLRATMGRDSTPCFSARLWSSSLPAARRTDAGCFDPHRLARPASTAAWVSGELHGHQQTVAARSPIYTCALAGHGWRWPCAPKASTSEDETARGVARHGRSAQHPGAPRRPSPAAASGFLVTPGEASGCWTRWMRSIGGEGLFRPPRGGWAKSTWRAPPGGRGRPPAPHPGRAPELPQAIDRDLDEVGIGGKPVSSRLHRSMHKIVANQLWDDEPPQTRQTARPLLALGYERHDVPHMLGSVAGEV
jgi:hypothetical protein